LTDETGCDEIADDGGLAPLVSLVDVREMHLDERDDERLECVMDRPRVMRPRAWVEDHSVGVVVGVVTPLDELSLVVRLAALHRELELAAPLVDATLELGDREAAVERRVPAPDDVEVDAVEDDYAHEGAMLSGNQL